MILINKWKKRKQAINIKLFAGILGDSQQQRKQYYKKKENKGSPARL